MDSWAIAIGVVLIVAFTMTLKDILHGQRCKSCRAARHALHALHPDWKIVESKHRATETNRDIVAVFFEQPPVKIEPIPYVLFAVDRSGRAEVLSDDQGSPYEIRGRK